MIELFNKIYAAYAANAPLLAALSGGLFMGKAKRSAEMPFGVLRYSSYIPRYTAGNVNLPQWRIEFAIYSDANNIEWDDLRTKLLAVFENATLTGASTTYTMTQSADYVYPDPDDIDVWDLIVEFLVDEVPT